jgi:integrase
LAFLLSRVDADLVPVIAIGAFAGIRREEIRRLDWHDVNLAQGTIRIRPEKAKSARNRFVPIEDNLADWLRPYAKAEGKVWNKVGNKRLTRNLRKAGFGEPGTETKEERKQGVTFRRPFPDNGLRHSYATYWLAKYQDSGKLSLHLGHTNSRIVFDHYRAPVPAEDAAAYWSIRPGGAENVIRMKRKGVA